MTERNDIKDNISRQPGAECHDYSELFRGIDALLKAKDTVIAAIDGNSGAGKSTLASLISGVYDCNVFHTDDYFLRAEQRTSARLAEPGGNFDRERFAEEVITGIKSGQPFSYSKFSCGTMTLGEPIIVQPKRLSVIEGSYSMHPLLRGNYDIKIFLQTGKDEQSKRILKRNGAAMHQRFLSEWIPMEDRYFESLDIKAYCDIVYKENT